MVVPVCLKLLGKVTILFSTLSTFSPVSNFVYPLLVFIYNID
ncbi:uncharacterized protein METZ01_LOCUS297251, partial [marine metagenome]